MSNTFNLTPQDNNYLTSRLLYNQLTDKKLDLILQDDVSANEDAKIILDGCGRAMLSGSLIIDDSTPGATYPLFSLPVGITIPKDYVFPVAVKRGLTYLFNAMNISHGGSSIDSVTVTTAGSYSSIPTISTSGSGIGAAFSPTMKAVSNTVATAQSSAGSYAPADTITLTGGTFTTASILTVSSTKVQSATVAAGGSGGADGTQTVTGTTGTGTKFQASVTISGGEITAVLSISVAGNYTVNPTLLTAEPVTGASLSGATLNIKMGVNAATITTAGSYTVLPSDPVAQGSTSGTGTGATFNMLWGVNTVSVTNGGSDYDSDSQIVFSSGAAAASIVLGDSNEGIATLINAPTEDDIVHLDGIQFLVNSYTV